MAWSASGLFGPFLLDKFDNTNLAADLGAEDTKLALWGASVTPDFNADTAYGSAPWNSGESSGAGYSAGGALLTTTTIMLSSGVLIFDADNFQLDNTTLTTEGGLHYFPNVSNRAFLAPWWGSPKSTFDGTILVTWNALGIARQDYTP